MFDNIGRKIKILAQVLCWIGIIGSVITGIAFLTNERPGLGVIIIFGGELLSWIGSFFHIRLRTIDREFRYDC